MRSRWTVIPALILTAALTACGGGDSKTSSDAANAAGSSGSGSSAATSGGGDHSKSSVCQTWLTESGTMNPSGGAADAYTKRGDLAEKLAGQVEDSELADALNAIAKSDHQAAKDIAAGKQPQGTAKSTRLFGKVGELCTAG